MKEDLILFTIRTLYEMNNMNNLIKSRKIYELEDKDLENELFVITILNDYENKLTEEETKVLKNVNDFTDNLTEKCKKEPLSSQEQKVLKKLFAIAILYSNKTVDKDALAILINKYILSQEAFSPTDLLLYTQHAFNFLNETQGNNAKLKVHPIDSFISMATQKNPFGKYTIEVNKTIFEKKQSMNKKKFYDSLIDITFGLLHESFHIRQNEYLKRVPNIEQEELFNDLLITFNQKAYKKYHDSLLIERTANEYAIHNLPYVLQQTVPEEEIITYLEETKKRRKTIPSKEYIENQTQLVQDAKELLTPENVKVLSEHYKK